jgi:hypothetical protein
MLVTGTFTIGSVCSGDPVLLASLEPDATLRRAAYQYLVGASRPGALQVLDAHLFAKALPLSALDLARPPQSYAWVMRPDEAT